MAKGCAPKNPATGLTAKEEAFCFETVRLGNPNRAYRVAYDASGMQPNSVRSEVAKLVRKPQIEDRLREIQAITDAKLGVTIERIAQELARLGFSDMGDIYDDAGQPIPFHLLPQDVRRAVKSVTIIERKGGMFINLKTGKQVAKKKGQKKADLQAAGIEWVPIREKRIELHDKQAPLQMLARWKKMIQDRGEEGEGDPNDVRRLTDEALEAELRADKAALEMIERARKRRGAVKKPEAAPSKAG